MAYAGLGGVLWNAAGTGLVQKAGAELAQQAVSGVIGNEAHARAVRIGHAVREKLWRRRGLSENHDIAKGLRLAQIIAARHVVDRFEASRKNDPNPPKAFLAAARAGLDQAQDKLAALDWDTDLEDAMFASYQQAFREPNEAETEDAAQARIAEQVTDLAWAELLEWAGGAHAPDPLRHRFYGKTPNVIGFHQAWCGEVVAQAKASLTFQTAFFAGKLVEIGDLAIDGQATLARLEQATEGVREQLDQVRAEIEKGFADQHARHDQTQAMVQQLIDAASLQGRILEADALARAETVVRETAGSTSTELAEARTAIENQDPIALIDSLVAAATTEAAERLREAGDIAYALDVGRAAAIFEKAALLEPRHVWTWIALTRLHKTLGDLVAARASAERALAFAINGRDKAGAYDELGGVAAAEGDLPAARTAYEHALDIRRDFCAHDSNNTEWLRDLSISYNRLGDIARAEGDLPAARKAYEEDLTIARDLSARDPEGTQLQRDLAVSLSRLGNVARAEGDLPAAREAYEDALEIAHKLTALDPKNPEWQRDLSVGYGKIGDIAIAEGDLLAGRKAYEDSLHIILDLSGRDPKNTERLRDLSISYNKLGDIAQVEGNLPNAFKAYQDGLDIRLGLSARDPKNTEWLRDLSISYSKLGNVARAEGNLPAARKAYEDSLEIARNLSSLDPKNTHWLRDLSVSYSKLGDIAVAEGDLRSARRAYEHDLDIVRDLSSRDPKNTDWLRDLSIGYNRLGDIARAENDLPAARKAYSEDLAIARDLSARDPKNAEWLRDLAVSHAKLGQVSEVAGDLAEACKMFREAERIFRQVLALSPSHAETRRMADLAAARAARACG